MREELFVLLAQRKPSFRDPSLLILFGLKRVLFFRLARLQLRESAFGLETFVF